jgi:hypothetical protein
VGSGLGRVLLAGFFAEACQFGFVEAAFVFLQDSTVRASIG